LFSIDKLAIFGGYYDGHLGMIKIFENFSLSKYFEPKKLGNFS
jgi:hypothetical protein